MLPFVQVLKTLRGTPRCLDDDSIALGQSHHLALEVAVTDISQASWLCNTLFSSFSPSYQNIWRYLERKPGFQFAFPDLEVPIHMSSSTQICCLAFVPVQENLKPSFQQLALILLIVVVQAALEGFSV